MGVVYRSTAGSAVFGPESAGGWCAATFGWRSRGEVWLFKSLLRMGFDVNKTGGWKWGWPMGGRKSSKSTSWRFPCRPGELIRQQKDTCIYIYVFTYIQTAMLENGWSVCSSSSSSFLRHKRGSTQTIHILFTLQWWSFSFLSWSLLPLPSLLVRVFQK